MDARLLLNLYAELEQLKDTTRHCYTSKGRRESVAEHSWMIALLSYLMHDEFPEADMSKVMTMCLIHDIGECFTGDIPAFDKNSDHEENESALLDQWVASLPAPYAQQLHDLYAEMNALETVEAKIYKAIDNLEAVMQHNLSDISTWIPIEYELNMTYGDDKVAFSQYLKVLREEIRNDTKRKIGKAD